MHKKINKLGDIMQTAPVNDLPEARRACILRYINSMGSATIKELANMLSVSDATIRRDLDELDTEKLVERIHGGAQALKISRTAFETAYRDKSTYMVEEKARIGFSAASFVENGDTILLDSGTTSLQIARHLAEKKNITVITYDLYIANSIELDQSSTLIVTGGIRRSGFGVLTGSMVRDFIRSVRVDKSFLSADAVDIDFGVSNATLHEADLKKELIHSGQKVYLVADHSKFGNLALVQVCSLSDIDLLITDAQLSPKYQQLLDSSNCKYILV